MMLPNPFTTPSDDEDSHLRKGFSSQSSSFPKPLESELSLTAAEIF